MQLRLLSSYVTRMGYVSFIANGILEASEILNSEHIDLIILDLNIPKVSGYSILGLLAEKNVNIPIVICSSTLHLVSDVEFIHGNKSYKFLNKPVTFDVFIETVHESLNTGEKPPKQTPPEPEDQTPPKSAPKAPSAPEDKTPPEPKKNQS